jgi:hypothetical protein
MRIKRYGGRSKSIVHDDESVPLQWHPRTDSPGNANHMPSILQTHKRCWKPAAVRLAIASNGLPRAAAPRSRASRTMRGGVLVSGELRTAGAACRVTNVTSAYLCGVFYTDE